MVTLVLTVSRSLVSTPGVFGILFRLGEQKKTLGAHRPVSENLTDACGVGQGRRAVLVIAHLLAPHAASVASTEASLASPRTAHALVTAVVLS